MSFSFYDFSIFTSSVHSLLSENMPSWLVLLTELTLVGVVFLVSYAIIGLILVYAERKVCAFIQNRIGPNRTGPFGILQTTADLIKLLMKELVYIKNSDKYLYNIAPFIVIIASMMALAAIPYAKGLQAMDFNIGVFYVISVSSIGVIGILLAGWSSNSKYSLIGAMRSGAQIISYELSVGLSLLTIIIFSGSMQLSEIVANQADGWWIWKGHLPAFIAFVIFMISSTAETNRGPFDIAEAESELAAGFHTEYSGIKFAFFFLAEFMNMFIAAALGATVFLGGWQPLHFGTGGMFNEIMDFIPPIVWFFGKSGFLVLIFMWFRWTFPRLRVDQVLTLEWKYLLPFNLVNLLLAAFVVLMGWHL